MIEQVQEKKFDVFISYAREDKEWVKENLYERLLKYQTKDGRRVKIFMDTGKEGIRVSQNWLAALDDAILNSRKFLAVYSKNYFASEMCQREIDLCITLDPQGNKHIINPILIDHDAESLIPFGKTLINYLTIDNTDWFEKLCVALELEPIPEKTVLEFINQPIKDIIIEHTLPPVKVALKTESGGKIAHEEEIAISAENAELQGTLTVETKDGEAIFSDLSIGKPISQTCLIATAKGCDPVSSIYFSVCEAPKIITTSRILMSGEVIFFCNSKSVAVITDKKLLVYDYQANQLGKEMKISGHLKTIKREGSILVMSDWSGNIYLITNNGQGKKWSESRANKGINIPGDLAVDKEIVYIGYWSGRIYRSNIHEFEPVEIMNHKEGIQAIDVINGHLYVVTLDGNLYIYQEDGLLEKGKYKLENSIYLLKAYENCIIAVGNKELYYIPIDGTDIYKQKLPFSEVTAILGDTDHPIAVNSKGQGIRFNSDLFYEHQFHIAEGAIPVSADNDGKYSIFRNPNGSRILMVGKQVVFTYSGGTLAISPDAENYAIGSDDGIQIVDSTQFYEMIKGESDA